MSNTKFTDELISKILFLFSINPDTITTEQRDKVFNILNESKEDEESTGFDGSNKANAGTGRNIAYHIPTSPLLEARKKKIMDNASPEAIAYLDPLNYPGPVVIRDASTMTADEWQEARKNSIGSSAIAQVFGESPYEGCTNVDLYNQKIGAIPVLEESKSEKDTKELLFAWGHAMEYVLQTWVSLHWPGCKLVIDTNIYASRKADFLTTNLDGMLQLPDGTWEHVEFKTTSEYNEDFFRGIIPQHYKRQLIQCQHILGVWKSRLVALEGRDLVFGHNDFYTLTYERDLDEEYEQVLGGIDFWNNHVLPKIPPEPKGPADNIIKSIRKYNGNGDAQEPETLLSNSLFKNAERLNEISSEISNLEAKIKVLKKEKDNLMVPIAMEMGASVKAYTSDGNTAYEISWKPRNLAPAVDTKGLKRDYPDIYSTYVTEKKNASRPMTIKPVLVRQ